MPERSSFESPSQKRSSVSRVRPRPTHTTFAGFQIAHDGEVDVPLLDGLFVDSDALECSLRAPLHTSTHGASHDRIDLVPTQAEPLCRGRDRHFTQQGNSETFEERCERTGTIGPRHGELMDAVLGTRDARNASNDVCLEFVEVKMTPAPLTVIMNRTGFRADGARFRSIVDDPRLDDELVAIDLYALDAPWRLDVEELLLELDITHVEGLRRNPVGLLPAT